MAVGRAGHSSRIKDLVRDFQKLLLSRALYGTPAQRTREAQAIATRSANAAKLREMAAIGTDNSRDLEERVKQIHTLVLESLQELGVESHVRSSEVDELLTTIRTLLQTPDFDVVYQRVIDHALNLMDKVLGDTASAAQPGVSDPLDHLRRRTRTIITKFRHGEFTVDSTCDKFSVAIGWQCCALGLTDDALPDLSLLIDSVHTLLEDTEKKFHPQTT